MSNYRRRKYYGDYFFFTLVTYNRRKFLTDEKARGYLRQSIERTIEDYPFVLTAFCLLPDHLHCIFQLPADDKNYSLRLSLIKKRFTHMYLKGGGVELNQTDSRKEHRHRGIWQKRFWEHCIRNEDDLNNHINYIHYNPVKHRYVEQITDWPWSTYNKYLKSGYYRDVDLNELQNQLDDLDIAE